MNFDQLIDWFNSITLGDEVSATCEAVNLNWLSDELKREYANILAGNVMDSMDHDGSESATYQFYFELAHADVELRLKSLYETYDMKGKL